MNKENIDSILKTFKDKPTREDYNYVYNWYEQNKSIENSDYLICIYLFLIGANIKHRYVPINYDQHKDYISEIKDIINNSSEINKIQRKIYLEYGLKSGYYK